MFNLRKCRIGVVGLGYVGLPMAVELGRHFNTVGFDINANRIGELKAGRDSTLEASKSELVAARLLSYTTNPAELRRCRVYIVTVPTPIDEYKRPDLRPLVGASETRRQSVEERRRGCLRIHGLSRLHRGSLRADPGA
jgi:UDP-N-acetyl-D-galactosamine dehydrogenase